MKGQNDDLYHTMVISKALFKDYLIYHVLTQSFKQQVHVS